MWIAFRMFPLSLGRCGEKPQYGVRLYPSLVIALYKMDRPLSSFKKCAVAAADDDGDDEEKLGWGLRSSGPNPKPPTLNGFSKLGGSLWWAVNEDYSILVSLVGSAILGICQVSSASIPSPEFV